MGGHEPWPAHRQCAHPLQRVRVRRDQLVPGRPPVQREPLFSDRPLHPQPDAHPHADQSRGHDRRGRTDRARAALGTVDGPGHLFPAAHLPGPDLVQPGWGHPHPDRHLAEHRPHPRGLSRLEHPNLHVSAGLRLVPHPDLAGSHGPARGHPGQPVLCRRRRPGRTPGPVPGPPRSDPLHSRSPAPLRHLGPAAHSLFPAHGRGLGPCLGHGRVHPENRSGSGLAPGRAGGPLSDRRRDHGPGHASQGQASGQAPLQHRPVLRTGPAGLLSAERNHPA